MIATATPMIVAAAVMSVIVSPMTTSTGAMTARGAQEIDNHHRRSDNLVNAVNGPHAKRTYDTDYAKLLDGPCPIHKGAKHTMRECMGLAKALFEE